MQVVTCISWTDDRRLEGPGRPDEKEDPGRAERAERPDAVRDLLPARHQASARLVPPGHLPAPRRSRGRGLDQERAPGAVQVPRARHHAARANRRQVAPNRTRGGRMRINLTSVLVDDQDKALRFYTDVLGFEKKTEIPLGPQHRWLTVVSSDDPDGTELVLEPDQHPAAKPFKEALVRDGIPFTSFAVDDVQQEFERLAALGVRFTQEPTQLGPVTTAVFDDTCGNLIQIAQQN